MGSVPWHLTSFLADAHRERQILRQSGAVYQFRHLELRDSLVATYQEHAARSRGWRPGGQLDSPRTETRSPDDPVGAGPSSHQTQTG